MRHQLRPLFDRVMIKELDPDRVRRSGRLVPPGTDEPPPRQRRTGAGYGAGRTKVLHHRADAYL